MRTHGDLWASLRLLGTHGDSWGALGTFGDLWGLLETHGDLLGLRGTYEDSSVQCDEIARLLCHYGMNPQFSLLIGNTTEIATLQRHIKGIGALKFHYANWVYTHDLPMPLWHSIHMAEFWTSSKYVDFRSHLAKPRNFLSLLATTGLWSS